VYSERHGHARQLSAEDLCKLVWKRIARAREGWLFREAFGIWKGLDGQDHNGRLGDAEEFLMMRLKKSGLGYALGTGDSPPAEVSLTASFDGSIMMLLDIIELLHAEAVSKPLFVHPPEDYTVEAFDKEAGQEIFREQVNEALAVADPPLELLPIGHIVEKGAEHRDLYVEPVPDGTPPEVGDPVRTALDEYLRRGATVQQKRSAVKHLPDALEHLAPRSSRRC
jgi:hypothetical protein